MPNLSKLNLSQLSQTQTIPVKGVAAKTPLRSLAASQKPFRLQPDGRLTPMPVSTPAEQPQTEDLPDAEKITVEELGRHLRSKSPDGLDSLTDTEIGERILMRKPDLQRLIITPKPIEQPVSWTEQIKSINLPNLGIGALKGAASTALSMGEIGSGLLEKGYNSTIGKLTGKNAFTGAETAKAAKDSKLMERKNLGEKIGFTTEQIAEYFLPVPGGAKAKLVSKATQLAGDSVKAAKLLGMGTRVLTEGAEMGTKAYLQTGSTQEAKSAAALGATGAAAGEVFNVARSMTRGAREAISGVDTVTLNVLDPNRRIPQSVVDAAMKEKGIIDIGVSLESQKAVEESGRNYLKLAKRAAADPRLETPLEVAGKKGMDALDVYSTKLNKWGIIKQDSLKQVGDNLMEVGTTKKSLSQLLSERLGSVLDESGNVINAPGRVSSISLDAADQTLLKKVSALLNNLDDADTLYRVDGTIDAIQDILYKRSQNVAEPINGQVEGLLKEIIGELNGRLKRAAGPTYTKANAKYAYFIETRDKLNKALGNEGSKGGSLMKRVFSPTDGGMKVLFAKIKRDTGVDLVKEAALAKAAMELSGDVRQRSMLESLDLLRPGSNIKNAILEKAINVMKNKFANPEDVFLEAARGAKLKASF